MTPAAIFLGGYLAVLATIFALGRRDPRARGAVHDLRWWAAGTITGMAAGLLGRSVPWPGAAVLLLASAGLIGYAHRRDRGREGAG